ncbi:MAG TPA: alpha/beta fold hydrolase [Vicinamibacterales bacterium]|nr:alpha/beta fold hydrolase [Vicinamibacterales bacterium]
MLSNMKNSLRLLAGAVLVCGAGLISGHSASAASDTPVAPLLAGLGTHEWPVTTGVPRARQFFNQGVRLLYAFNFPEALRSFREAARLDPALAMAYWGQAMAVGPNLNAPLSAENASKAYDAIQAARRAADGASPRERALVEALASRFAAAGIGDRPALDRAYAAAMERVAAAYPNDPDVQTFYADAVMNTMPWDYWQKDGSPKPATARVLQTIESVIAAHPRHPGAHHYYIHAMEASDDPDRALKSADVLGSLMPSAGHMVHMPAHIYLRVGRYADAAEANVRAIAADEDYLAQCQAQGLYPITYYPHNLHFLWAAATLEGRRDAAVAAARQVAEKVPHHHAGAVAWTADFPVTPWLAFVRFGMWTEMLTAPPPPASDPYATGIWHYGRGLALVARGQLDRAATEIGAVESLASHDAFKTTLKDSPLQINLQIAARIVKGELAARRGAFDAAVRVLEEAVALEDAIPYNEPPVWHHPVRQVLGGVLLDAGRAREAETVYRADLVRVRENGWSLFGLARSLELQQRSADAAAVRERFAQAWKRADITLTSSRIIGSDRRPSSPADARVINLPGGVTLSYAAQGDPAGTPVILLHGITDSLRSFEPILPHLPRSLRVFAISQRGHGDSSRPAGGYTPRQFAADVARFMDALGLPRAVIVGHSMGAGNAMRFAADYPGRTVALVMIGALGRREFSADVLAFDKAVSTLSDPIDRQFAHDFQMGTIARPIAPALVETFVDESLKVPARVWRSALTGLMGADIGGTMRRVNARTLIIWGTRDSVAPRADQEALLNGIRGAELKVYEAIGHAVHWEDPARVAADIVAFVSTERHRTRTSASARR